MKHQINSSGNIFNKFSINIQKKNLKNDYSSQIFLPNFEKLKIINNKNNTIHDYSYIPKHNILKILVRNQKSNNLIDKNKKIIIPLRNRVCEYQNKNEIITKEINMLRNESKSFLDKYKTSLLLTPKNESHFLKLGINEKIIKDIELEGYKMNDILNKTNIFDKSLILIKRDANFARKIMEEKNSELINDDKYIIKMNESLNELKNNDYLTYNNYSTERKKDKKINSIYNKLINNQDIEEGNKVSAQQLINEFKNISNDLKMINNKKFLKGNIHKKLIQKANIKKTIQNSKNKLIKNEINDKRMNNKENKFPPIKKIEDIKVYGNLKNINNISKSSINDEEVSLKNEETKIEKDNKVSLPILKIPKRKIVIKNIAISSTNKDSSKNSLKKYFKSSTNLNRENKNYKSYKNKGKNYISINKRRGSFINIRNNSLINKIFLNSFSIDDSYSKVMNKTEYACNNKKMINDKIDENKKTKNCLLQNLYNKINLKRFDENKKDISEYFKICKGINIKEPNYETGSQIYNVINDFITKTKNYNLANEIPKIRNKTNVFYYKRSKKFQDILKLNNKMDNLIYDYVEDILDLNNDIKK